MRTVYVNGDYLNPADARISVFDRGLLFGDSIYEVIPVYRSRPVFLQRHLDRLNSNFEKTQIAKPDCDWHTVIDTLVAQEDQDEMQVYLQVTRGNQGMRKHDVPEALKPTVIAFVLNNPFPTEAEKENGLRAQFTEDIRWMRCDIKSTSLQATILMNNQAVGQGYQTAILVRNGCITEGAASNIFMLNESGLVKTPPLTHWCLPGITRQVTLEILSELKQPFKEENISQEELLLAKEVWVTGTTKEIYPVVQIGRHLINNGKPGPCWREVNQSYNRLLV